MDIAKAIQSPESLGMSNGSKPQKKEEEKWAGVLLCGEILLIFIYIYIMMIKNNNNKITKKNKTFFSCGEVNMSIYI